MPEVVLIGCMNEENLSLGYLAGACDDAGVGAEIVGLSDAGQIEAAVEQTLRAEPSLVGVSLTFQAHAKLYLRLIARLREEGFGGHLCAGGHFATFCAEELLRDVPGLDSVALHEGEQTLVELARALPSGELPSGLQLRGRRTGVRPLLALEQLPRPRRPDPARAVLGVPAAPVLASRGCYGSCTFCSVQSWYAGTGGPRNRQRSASDVADELALLHDTRGVRVFSFEDDNFFCPDPDANLRRARELADALASRGVSGIGISIKCRPVDVGEAILDELQRIGLLRVYAGIETTSAQGLRCLGRAMRAEDNDRALERLQARGVYHAFNMLLFDPDTTLESLQPNLALLRAHVDVPFDFCRVQIYAGTPLEKRLLRESRLRGSYQAWSYDLLDPRAEVMFRIADVVFQQRNFEPTGMAMQNLSLRLEAEVLRRFYGETARLHAEIVEFSRSLGASSVGWLDRMWAFASETDPRDAQAIHEFAEAAATEVRREDFARLKRLRELRAAMQAHASDNAGGTVVPSGAQGARG